MDQACTRRKFFQQSILGILAGSLAKAVAAAACSEADVGGQEHDIPVVTSDPYERWLVGPKYGRWQTKPLAVLKAKSVELPWHDPIMGCADPYIGVTGNGDIYATTATVPKLLKSADGGRAWTSSDFVLNPPYQGALDGDIQNFGILRDDTFIIGYQSDKKYRVARSTDLGQTWEPSVELDTSPYGFAGGTTHGFLLQLPDGQVLLPVSRYDTQTYGTKTVAEQENETLTVGQLVIFRSKDGGKTWGDMTPVTLWGWEPSLIRLASGRLMIAVRYQRCEGGACVLPSDPPLMAEMEAKGYPKDIYTAYSDDGGISWGSWNRVTTGVFDAPGQLIQLSDGRLILTYAHRAPDPPPCGTWAMVSRDEGRTWENERYILNSVCDRPFDFGYAASVVLENDNILTLSGCRGIGWPDKPQLNRKSPGGVQAIRWRLE